MASLLIFFISAVLFLLGAKYFVRLLVAKPAYLYLHPSSRGAVQVAHYYKMLCVFVLMVVWVFGICEIFALPLSVAP